MATLDDLARERAGDPGPVVLRRLSNAEYTFTMRDLTGLPTLDPAREFPVDGAAGEGFTNTGQALVMSPALITKYLDAAKEIASHAVLLPDGIRFSSKTTRRDWTEEIVGRDPRILPHLHRPARGCETQPARRRARHEKRRRRAAAGEISDRDDRGARRAGERCEDGRDGGASSGA